MISYSFRKVKNGWLLAYPVSYFGYTEEIYVETLVELLEKIRSNEEEYFSDKK